MAVTFLIDNSRGIVKTRGTLLAAGLLSALTLLAYSNTFNAPFQFDDYHQIVNNPNIRDIANMPRFFIDPTLGSFDVTLRGYRPMTFVSFALDYAVPGSGPWAFHLTNTLLHVINAFLVFLVVGAVLKVSGGKEYPAALLAALVFALHPIQTGAVTYISGRAALLAGMFCLLALHGFMRYRTSGSGAWAVMSPVFFLMGLLSKEMAVCLPAVMLAYDLVFTAGKRLWLYYTPFAAALSAYLLIRRSLSGYYVEPFLPHGIGAYLMSEARALLVYARLMVLPFNQDADYNMPATASVDAWVVVSALLILAALVYLYRIRKRHPAIAFFGFWSFIALAPESSFVPITDVAVEYRLYLPSAGLIAALACAASMAPIKSSAVRKAAAVSLIVTLGVLSFNRNFVWASETSLWRDVVKKTPGSARAHGNLGNAYYHDGRYSDAIREFSLAAEIDPGGGLSYVMHNNLGLCYYEVGMYEEALQEFAQSVRLYPDFAEAYCNMGAVFYDTGRFREAEAALKKAVDLNPGFNLAHMDLGLTYRKTFRYEMAAGELEEAARLSPRDFEVRYNLALAYYDMGRKDLALEQARAALGYAVDDGQAARAGALVSEFQGRR